MIKSMTAFGRAETVTPSGRWVLEILSVNRKTLDISTHIPRELMRFDIELRQLVAESVSRGTVTVRLGIQLEQNDTAAISSYKEKLKPLKEGWSKVARDLGYNSESAITFPFLLGQLELGSAAALYPEDKEIKKILKDLSERALKEFEERKKAEGYALLTDVEHRLSTFEKDILKIKKSSSDSVNKYREKLLGRIKEVCEPTQELDERILREIAFFAEKIDISEEIVRLESHIQQFSKELYADQKSVGRALDFLTQEMHREVNTIASKSADIEVLKATMRMKTETEKIREQVQNIE